MMYTSVCNVSMYFIYDLLAKKHGEGDKAKGIYRVISLIAIAIITLVISGGVAFASYKYQNNNIVWYCVAGVVFIWGIAEFIGKLRDRFEYLHVSPDMNDVDFKGGKVTYKDMHGKELFTVTYPGKGSVTAGYEGNRYRFTVKNPEWDEIQNFYALDTADFGLILSRAIEYTCELEPEPEGEYDDTPAESAPTDEYTEEDADVYDQDSEKDDDEDDIDDDNDDEDADDDSDND